MRAACCVLRARHGRHARSFGSMASARVCLVLRSDSREKFSLLLLLLVLLPLLLLPCSSDRKAQEPPSAQVASSGVGNQSHLPSQK